MPDSDSALSEHRASGPVSSLNPNLKRQTRRTKRFSTRDYLQGIRDGDRVMLGRAITLIESTRPADREQAHAVLDACTPATANTVRVGVTGIPGVGKSTFIEALGLHLVDQGHRLAVLTVDPSSERSRGSILGDKTRMPNLATHDQAFIRPSPTSGSLGGVARTTRETILLCEAAGYTHVIVETVGVGQSETAVRSMVDAFLLLALANTGDELQGIKRGIMEMADVIVINKADASPETALNETRRTLKQALQLLPERATNWTPPVATCSALRQQGIDAVWQSITEYVDHLRDTGAFDEQRSQQTRHWLRETINHALQQDFYADPKVQSALGDLESDVASGAESAYAAAQMLIETYRSTS
ncbi:MAG: methylmalonyl Co-A mutase-associated GTPase MeaB [Longimonas sp.]|uniref:methylmalonyl Co-A mutase-associated GTPase MeaB n=1 Tax=Longimonas sp. TaxID=2039626 RepID=UPI00335DDFD8